jgi:shikimate dehydrogenase
MALEETPANIEITGESQLAGIIGWPVAHSLSPLMHNAAARALGLNMVYVPLPVQPEALSTAIKGLATLGFRGVNITVPHKEKVMALLDRIDPAAAAIGAVNTLVIDPPINKKLEALDTSESGELSSSRIITGYNTDWSGFLAHLDKLAIEIRGRQCLLLGAGGSARAVAYALATRDASIHIYGRRIEQAEQLVSDIGQHFEKELLQARSFSKLHQAGQIYKEQTLIINTTPVGMAPKKNETPWPTDLNFPERAIVYDLIYSPADTRLMRQARNSGCVVTNGLGMLLYQGAEAFQLWTDRKPDLEIMANSLIQNYNKISR